MIEAGKTCAVIALLFLEELTPVAAGGIAALCARLEASGWGINRKLTALYHFFVQLVADGDAGWIG